MNAVFFLRAVHVRDKFDQETNASGLEVTVLFSGLGV